ncbi:PPE family protein [Mycobacterium haemophilum]|uniref:PPE family protein n=1 Tax=Mycobacterium haemophilum TaxID=29311 RepID=UPI0009E1C2FF|nr:PPE family protein [Mycobacterium haemophilum]
MPNFNALPPEVNASNIQGPGSTPIRTAVKAWGDLTVEFYTQMGRWKNQVSATQDSFKGPAARHFIGAANQYTSWLNGHAGTASATAVYLGLAAQAYDRAVKAMVPTSAIVANRAAALTMKTTNLLGQFTTKIAELDRAYQEMWAQNAAAMNEYQFAAFEITRQVEEAGITPAPQIIHSGSSRSNGYHPISSATFDEEKFS